MNFGFFFVVKHISYKITYSTGILGELLLFISTVLKTALESVTPSPGFIALPLIPQAPLSLDPAQAQVQGTFWKLGFFKEREFSSLIPFFPAKGRPVLGVLVPEKKAPSLLLSNRVSCKAQLCRVLSIVMLEESFVAANVHSMVGVQE